MLNSSGWHRALWTSRDKQTRFIVMFKHKPPLFPRWSFLGFFFKITPINANRTSSKESIGFLSMSVCHLLVSFISSILLSPARCHWRPDTPRPSGGRCIPSWSPRSPRTTDEPGCLRRLMDGNKSQCLTYPEDTKPLPSLLSKRLESLNLNPYWENLQPVSNLAHENLLC